MKPNAMKGPCFQRFWEPSGILSQGKENKCSSNSQTCKFTSYNLSTYGTEEGGPQFGGLPGMPRTILSKIKQSSKQLKKIVLTDELGAVLSITGTYL